MRAFLPMACLLLSGLFSGVCHADLAPIDDDHLAAVTGTGNGIAFEIQTLINTDTTGAPLTGFGAGCSSNDTRGLTNLAPQPCSAVLALQFSGRQGAWLVMKDYYGILSIPTLNLDAYLNPTTNTSYYNSNRFKNDAATPACISDMSTCNPAGMGSFAFTFPNSAQTDFTDIGIYLHIGRLAIEYDATATSCPTINSGTGTNCGYNQDAFGGFAGVIVSDTSAARAQAQISVAGRVRVYGF
jgi:hypothetical protein